MRFNNGLGKVTEKNIEILKDTLAYGRLIAVKHSNGKDWWVVTPRRRNNMFYILRLTKDGIVDTLTQSIGITPDYTTEGYGQIVFSPDGSKINRQILNILSWFILSIERREHLLNSTPFHTTMANSQSPERLVVQSRPMKDFYIWVQD